MVPTLGFLTYFGLFEALGLFLNFEMCNLAYVGLFLLGLSIYIFLHQLDEACGHRGGPMTS